VLNELCGSSHLLTVFIVAVGSLNNQLIILLHAVLITQVYTVITVWSRQRCYSHKSLV